jgi:hypothetical protein
MVSVVYKYQANACAHCGAVGQDLFVLELVHDQDPALRPARPAEVGLCLESWRLVRVAIGYAFARKSLELGHPA